MELLILCGTRYLKTKAVDLKLFNGFLITNDKSGFSSEFTDIEFIHQVGTINMNLLLNSPIFFNPLRISPSHPFLINKTVSQLLDYYSLSISIFLLASWLIKDNSINFGTFFLYNPENNKLISNTRYSLFSNSSGEYRELELDESGLESVHSMALKIKEFTSEPADPESLYIKDQLYHDLNRFERTLNFIALARGQSVLPLKISFYIGSLEALLTTDSIEVSHKVCERATLLLGGDIKHKKVNFNFIKTCYGIRSSFLHGQTLSKKLTKERLKETSNKLDSLVRELLLSVMTSFPEILKIKDKDDDELFLELILK